MFRLGYLITTVFGIILTHPYLVTARFCEEGHICPKPRECCTQGCCPPYQNGPRQLPPSTDHVLNLFFISHWYFWCLVVAIIFAILCAYSLWRKRRQLCGWGPSDHHTQSEGDSAGSCYAPPQYSRCSSFHHPPPPYTEVTSKPDLYPLVFTCNSDNGKNGTSYLMVQYFRNYIVRPAGSLSATSTVDSLSSSFICTSNEANTLVPPPYSRAASPDAAAVNSHFQHYLIPRSASQLVCMQDGVQSQNRNGIPTNSTNSNNNNINNNNNNNNNSNNNTNSNNNNNNSINNKNNNQQEFAITSSQMRNSESVNFQNFCVTTNRNERCNSVIGSSQSDQQFRYNANSNSSISDIFVNSCNGAINTESGVLNEETQAQTNTSVAYSNAGTNQFSRSNNINNNNNNNNNNNPMYNSCGSIGGISITVPVATDGENEYRDLDVLRRSLETCCQILQQQQMPSVSFNSEDSPVNVDVAKKFDGIRSYVTSTTCSAVSSLANIGSPSSPPQATSPTGEVKELLEQIRQFQVDNSLDKLETQQVPSQHITNNTIDSTNSSITNVSSITGSVGMNAMSTASVSLRRPSSLQNKKKFFSKTNKAMYIPISSRSMRSPVGNGGILGRGRGRRGWISRSAPTTPGTTLPPSLLGDDSPLLNEHDEDAEQNA